MEKMKNHGIWKIIGASSLGTLIEWYDFYIFGSLATILSEKFFPSENPTAAFLSTLATFGAGFVVRPFGAIVFGRLGDKVGRKHTFLLTLLLMGGSTFLMGCIPTYEQIGFWAPFLVLLLRLLQGLALGGEYGGAATYVAEHAPPNKRGYWTSWIQTTATVGLFVSLLVILTTRTLLSEEIFKDWGWRIPFWVSVFMVIISYFIRKNMHESPLFEKAKAEGNISKNPLKESFTKKQNLKYVILALFGATMGQGVIWYTGQFYAMSFIEKICQVDKMQSDSIMTIALLCGTPLFLFSGWLSDRIGRKPLLLLGMLLAMVSYRPIYRQIHTVCSVEKEKLLHQEQRVGISNSHEITVTNMYANGIKEMQVVERKFNTETVLKRSIQLPDEKRWQLVFLVFIQVLFVTMVYGPIAAFLVELFPVSIRYTSMSFPYHVGNGIFGGLLPAISTYLASQQFAGDSENYLAGLWYPIVISAVCFAICLFFVRSNPEKPLRVQLGFVRQVIGVGILLLAGFVAYFGFAYFGFPKLFSPKGMEDTVFGIIIVFVLLPIITVGLTLLGWFSIRKEYEN